MTGAVCTLNIVLVVGLGGVELFGGLDLRRDGRMPPSGVSQLGDSGIGHFYLRIVGCPDARPILRSYIWTLAINFGWVVHFEEGIDELAIGNLAGVEEHLDGFGMPALSAAYGVVVGGAICTLHIATLCVDDTRALLEVVL